MPDGPLHPEPNDDLSHNNNNNNQPQQKEAQLNAEEEEVEDEDDEKTLTQRTPLPLTANKSPSSFGSDLSLTASLSSDTVKAAAGGCGGCVSQDDSQQTSAATSRSTSRSNSRISIFDHLSSQAKEVVRKEHSSTAFLFNDFGAKLKANNNNGGAKKANSEAEAASEASTEDVAKELFNNIEQLTLQAKQGSVFGDFAFKVCYLWRQCLITVVVVVLVGKSSK